MAVVNLAHAQLCSWSALLCPCAHVRHQPALTAKCAFQLLSTPQQSAWPTQASLSRSVKRIDCMRCHAPILLCQLDAPSKSGCRHRRLVFVTRPWLHAPPPPLLSRLIYRPKPAVARVALQLSTSFSFAALHPAPPERLSSPALLARLAAPTALVSSRAPLYVHPHVQADQPVLLFVRGIKFTALHHCQSALKFSLGMDVPLVNLNARADQAFAFCLFKTVPPQVDRKRYAPRQLFARLIMYINFLHV